MTLASLRDRLAAPLEWTADQIKARPKGTLVLWVVSLVVVARERVAVSVRVQ